MLPRKGYTAIYFLSTLDKISIILFAALSVLALGGARSLREAASRVPIFGGLMGQLPIALPLASIEQSPSLHLTSIPQDPKVRLS